MQSFPKIALLNQLSTYPVVRPHVLLSNPKEVLQRSLPTCSETHSSDELSMFTQLQYTNCAGGQTFISSPGFKSTTEHPKLTSVGAGSSRDDEASAHLSALQLAVESLCSAMFSSR